MLSQLKFMIFCKFWQIVGSVLKKEYIVNIPLEGHPKPICNGPRYTPKSHEATSCFEVGF